MSKKIGKYILEEKLSRGTFGVCYKAKDDKNNKYAIKKIEIVNQKETEGIINEINILKIMKSKHSVEFIESIKNEDYFYIIMELCEGDLNYLIKKRNGNIDIVTIIKITNQLNEVFQLMRKKKIEHRDLKPANILIKFNNEDDFDIKLTDYGLSKSYQNSLSEFTSIVGSDYYRAPEVYNNKGNPKSDLWSIGIIIYYLYFNQLPFKDFNDYFNTNQKVKLKKTNFELLDDLILKLIVKDSDKRINWDDYFNHPFNSLQIIQIYVNTEIDNSNTQILGENFEIEQLKDATIFIDENKEEFNINLNLNKGKHKIDILFNNILTSCESMFSECKEIIEIKFINFITNKVTDMSFMFNNKIK